jgi:hypothetical protein
VPAAVLVATAGGAALLATNFEISSVGLAAWLVLAAGVWLGFGHGGRGAWFVAGLALPALLLAVSGWRSAWQGQRSQFGYSIAPRAAYEPAASAGPAFAQLAGLRLPPELVHSLGVLDASLPEPDESGTRAAFLGLGMEWARRNFAVPSPKGQPLWIHWDTTYDAAAIARLRENLADESGPYRVVVTTVARDEWPQEIRNVLDGSYTTDHVGGVLRRWTRRDKDAVNLADSFETLSRLGGNLDGHFLHFDRAPLTFRRAGNGQLLLGTSRREGNVLLRAPTYRVRMRAALGRLPGRGDGPLYADLKVIVHGAVPEQVKWAARLELPAGEPMVTVPVEIDAQGKRLVLWAAQPPEQEGRAFAGYREIEITHGIEDEGGAPVLRPRMPAEVPATPEMAASLFGGIAWRPQELRVRGGRAGPEGLVLQPGGEVWIHTDGMTGEVRGQATAGGGGKLPFVRSIWFKGGRLQVLQNGEVPRGQPFDFHVWTAEPGGWIGIVADPTEGAEEAVVRIRSSTLIP